MKRIGRIAVLTAALSLALAPADARDPESNLAPDAPVALLVDLSAGGEVLYAREPDARFLPASVTKAMTALVAFELIRAGQLDEDRLITAKPETVARWAGKGTSMHLAPGQQARVRDLLGAITTVSANDGAAVLAEGVSGSVAGWTALMNAEAARLGMKGSHFGTPNGWPDQGRTYVTARDLIRLADALINRHPELYRRYFGRASFAWNGLTQLNHDPIRGSVPGADGIKTGHTFEAGFTFLGSAQRDGRRLVLVTARSWSTDGRAKAARQLLEWGFAEWDSRPLLRAGQQVATARVQLGDARNLPLVAPRAFAVAVPKGSGAQVTTRIRYDGPLRPPIRKGALVAALEVTIPGQPALILPLVAGEAVRPAGPIDRLLNGLARVLG